MPANYVTRYRYGENVMAGKKAGGSENTVPGHQGIHLVAAWPGIPYGWILTSYMCTKLSYISQSRCQQAANKCHRFSRSSVEYCFPFAKGGKILDW